MTEPRAAGAGTPSIKDLESEAAYARQRVALYQRRVFLGRGELPRLAELQRVSAGAAARLRQARDDERPGR